MKHIIGLVALVITAIMYACVRVAADADRKSKK